MKIEAGKCYRTRDGRKAYIYRIDAKSSFPVHGCVSNGQSECMGTWTEEGFTWIGKSENTFDLVAPWVDEPTMDISALPAWATHVRRFGLGWAWDNSDKTGVIPDNYCPKETVPLGSRYRIDRKANRLVLEEGGAK